MRPGVALCIYVYMYIYNLIMFIYPSIDLVVYKIYDPSQSIWHTLIVQLPLPFTSRKDNQEPVSGRRQRCTAAKC